jgi:TolB-like protein/DNA-binding winged helix-turn-helix (wHTH) protein
VLGPFRIDGWDVHPALNAISKDGASDRLEPKAMEVLVCLAEHVGEVVTKEVLLQSVWPDTFVADDALKHYISELRRVFRDDAREPRIIQTIPKRGYRLVASLEPIYFGSAGDNTTPAGAPVPNGAADGPAIIRRRLKWIPWAIGGVALFGMAVLISPARKKLPWISEGDVVPPIRSIAVLPLRNLSADPAQEYFSEGMTDALTTDLAQISTLRVISRTSAVQYKDTRKTLPEIARDLHVDGIVEGTVQRSGDDVRITVQLIYAPSDKHLWARGYEREVRDLFALERDLAAEISHAIQARVSNPSQAPLSRPRTLDPKALDAYLQGNYELNQFGSGAGDDAKRNSAVYFRKAIDEAPDFAPAYIGLAGAHRALLWPSKEDMDIVEESANRAVELDPSLSDAHLVLGWVNARSWKFRGAEEEYRKALVLNRNSVDAHAELGTLLDQLGRLDEGWTELQMAQELDPNHDRISDALMTRGQYDKAIQIVETMLKAHPNDGFLHWTLFKDLAKKEMYEQAADELEQIWTLYGYPNFASRVHRARALKGYPGAVLETAEILEHLMTVHQVSMPGNIAEFYATLGEKDRAFLWLERAYDRHEVQRSSSDLALEYLNIDFRLDSLRSDPRYRELVRRIGLPEVRIEEAGGERRTVVLAR